MKDPVAEHFERLRGLVEIEEAEEIEQFKSEFLALTPEERERTGKALLGIVISEVHFNPAGHRLITFQYARKRPIPLYSLDVGDLVSLSDSADFETHLPMGTVYERSADDITVAFSKELPDWVNEDGIYQLNRAGNRATYKKIHEALKIAAAAEHSRLAALRDILLGIKEPREGDPVNLEKTKLFNAHLNRAQKLAVKMALESPDVSLVHGPPGTGKTTVLIEIIRQAVGKGEFVFATAPSNTACDHLLECLVAAGVPALRLGHPARIMEHLRQHTLDFRLASHPHAATVEKLEFDLDRIYVHRDRKATRGRGLGRDERTDIKREIRDIKNEIQNLEDEIYTQVVREAPVMVGTHASATDTAFEKRFFDLLVMDEASQATEPSSWIPLLRAKRVVLAGDHMQLPPTVRSVEAEKKGLGVTLFERLHKTIRSRFKTLLNVQYRMNEKIMEFSSRQFYEGKLVADDSVRDHTLSGLRGVKKNKATEEPFLFLDTAGRGFEEQLEEGSQSRYNPEEAALVIEQVRKLIEMGVKPHQIAVISPYSAQVRLLSGKLSHPALEVDSVDGFQGREKEAVVLSLVRSNVEGEMGFLVDTRRMNVAMTRARRKLMVVGDSATLSSIPFYRAFIAYAESIGAYRSSWEEV